MEQDKLYDLMDAYLASSLEAQQRAEFEAMLASDANLRKELKMHKQIILAVQGKVMEDALANEEKKYIKQVKRSLRSYLSYAGAVLAMAACIAAYIILTPLVEQMTTIGNSQFTEYYSEQSSLLVRGADENIDLLAEAMDAIESSNWTKANKCLKTIISNAEGAEDAQLLQIKDDAEWLQAVVSMKRGRYFTAKRQLKAIANSNSAHAQQAQAALDSLK